MIRVLNNFQKYLIIVPIYILYIVVVELALGCSAGDIWDKLLEKCGLKKSEKTHIIV